MSTWSNPLGLSTFLLNLIIFTISNFFIHPQWPPPTIASSFLKTFLYPKKNCYSKYSDSDSDSDSNGYGDGDGDNDRCHLTVPWLHWSVNFEKTMFFCRAALATPVLLTTKLLDPGVKPTLFQNRMNLIYYLGDLIF